MTEGRADVEILGQRLSVRGRGTPEYIHQLAEYLNGRIETVRDQARVFDPLRLSLLAGLHVVDELYRCRETERAPGMDAQLLARVDRLTERLGAVLDGRARD
jgi:cell division protein ZapA (FtsZ GTPase activity inhibitor)